MDEDQPIKVIQVQKIEEEPDRPRTQREILEILATLCYFYPAYTLRAARRLPFKNVVIMLAAARKQEAIRYHNMVQIAAAPHTDKGKGVQDLSDQFRDVIDG